MIDFTATTSRILLETFKSFDFWWLIIKNIILPMFLGLLGGAFIEFKFKIIRKTKFKIVNKTKEIIKIKNKTDKSKKLWVLNFFSNNLFTFKDKTKKEDDKSNEDFRQLIMSEKPRGPLATNQIRICKQVTSITEDNSYKFDPESLYEKAVREKNKNGVTAATMDYYQLFNKIANELSNIAKDKGAGTQIDNLIYLVNGLYEMLNKSEDEKILKRQFDDCEEAISLVLAKIYDPN